MIQYDFVILLCPSLMNKAGKFEEFSLDGSYLGGQVRMQAAVDLYKKGGVKKFIVVGGGINNEKMKWDKVNDMRKYLIDNGVPKTEIVRISSKADTHGNLRAVYKILHNRLKGNVGILTNYYHLPRAMRFANDPQIKWNIKFIPICAEAVIKSSPPTYLQNIPSFLVRIFNDIKGLNDWEKGEYREQKVKEKGWRGELHPDDMQNLHTE